MNNFTGDGYIGEWAFNYEEETYTAKFELLDHGLVDDDEIVAEPVITVLELINSEDEDAIFSENEMEILMTELNEEYWKAYHENRV